MSLENIIVGLSGVSSSGKTTLARLLRDVFPESFVLHEDDFYWPDSQIPVRNGIQDWDCLEAIDVAKLVSCLQHIKQHGSSPADLTSKEDQNSVGECNIDQNVVYTWSSRVRKQPRFKQIILIDGFLLYSQQLEEVRALLDIKLFLRTDYKTAKSRREARSGYVTLEGFWEDPPEYVDKIVWPNYVKEHSFLFENGDVEGPYIQAVCDGHGITPVPNAFQANMTKTLDWACSKIFEAASAP